jgi:hypothetical protein
MSSKRTPTQKLVKALAPDGTSALTLGVGSFMVGAFLPVALGSVSAGVAWILLLVGLLLIATTVTVRVRRQINADCMVVVAPASRWPQSSTRVTQATAFAQRRFERHWVVPRQLPDDPRLWRAPIQELSSWLQMTLGNRGRSPNENRDLAILLLMPETVAWELARDWRGESIVVWQEGPTDAFEAIDYSPALFESSQYLDASVDSRVLEVQRIPRGAGYGDAPATATGHAIVIDIGRGKAEYELAPSDAFTNGAQEVIVIRRRVLERTLIARDAEHFTAVATECCSIVHNLIHTSPVALHAVNLYLNAPVSIVFSISAAIGSSLRVNHRVWSHTESQFVTLSE